MPEENVITTHAVIRNREKGQHRAAQLLLVVAAR